MVSDSAKTGTNSKNGSDPNLPKPRWYWSLGRKRLASEIPPYRETLKFLEQDLALSTGCKNAAAGTKESSPEPARRAHACECALSLLGMAEKAVRDDTPELGWRYFYAAHRMELYANPCALANQRPKLLTEAKEKLHGWRLDAVQTLLAQPDPKGGEEAAPRGSPEREDPDAVCRAMALLHEHLNDRYLKSALLTRQLVYLAGAAVAAFVLWLSVHWLVKPLHSVLTAPPRIGEFRVELLPSVAVFGLIGAAVSGLLTLASPDKRTKIPDQIYGLWVALTRLIVGIISGVIIYLAIASNIVNFGDLLSMPLVLFLAFAAGFSERLVLRSLETVLGKEERVPPAK